jgi:type I restriction enzyme, S subunit
MSWTTVKLADLATVSSGGGAPQDPDAFTSEGIPFIRAGSLIKLLEGLPEDKLELLLPEVAAAHKLKLFPAGTVVFAKSGMSATKGHIYQLKNPAYVVNHLACLIPHSLSVGRYLHRVLQFKSPTCLIKDEAYPSIRLGEIEEMEVPAPKEEVEKKRIAAILDQADELRRKRQRALDRLNQLGQAIFYEMFGDPKQNTKKFRAAPLTQAFDFKTGKLDSNAAVIGGQYPFFTCAKEVFSIDKFAFDCEALMLAGNNASATYDVKYYKGKFNAYQRTYVIQVNEKFEISYLYAKVALENSLQDLKRFSKGSNTKYITMEILSRMEILIPPISLQRKFEMLYCEVLERNIALGNALATHISLFETLQYRAFKGEL